MTILFKHKNKSIIPLLATAFVFITFLFIFFYKLGNSALQSYDEAWYADITRNLVRTKNPLHLIFNGMTFTDHPPLGFLLMAIPTTLFGSNEFTIRVISAFLGVLSLWLIYLIGKELKDIKTGIGASLILFSSMWFMYRARSGNLDVPFVFWQLVIFFAVVKLKEKSSYLYLVTLGLACLFLTKTLIGVGILPLVLLGIWTRKNEIPSKTVFKSILLMALLILPWYIYNQIIDKSFLYHHFFIIGNRGAENSYNFEAINKSLFYLRVGIGKWYKLFLASLAVNLIIFLKSKKTRFPLLLLTLGLLGFGIPFLFSTKTEVWHLIPLYPFVALLTSYSIQEGLNIFFSKVKWLNWLALFCIVGISIFQFSQFSNLMYFSKTPFSAEKDISLKAGKYNSEIYLMETFYPAAVYYSDQKVVPLYWYPNAYQVMKNMLLTKNEANKNIIFIINKIFHEKLLEEHVQFNIVTTNNDYLIIKQK